MEEMTFEEFSREVNNIYKKNCEVYYKLASHFGMTETMFDILYFVRENDGGYTQAQLCESLHLRKQTVNSALKKLEKDGVICLSQDSGNKKSKTIHFTEKGKELAQSTVDPIFELEQRAFKRLTSQERENVLYYGYRHIDILEDEMKKLLERNKKKTIRRNFIYADQIIRSFYLQPLAAFYAALCGYDDRCLHLQRGRWIVCIQSCGSYGTFRN